MVVNSIKFNWNNYLIVNNFNQIEKYLFSQVLTNKKKIDYKVQNTQEFNDCRNISNKYSLNYEINRGRCKSYNFIFVLPNLQTDNNIIQNLHFHTLEKYKKYILKNNIYDHFIQTNIYSKIKDSENIILANYDLNDIYNLHHYAKYFNYNFTFDDNNLIINKKKYEDDYITYDNKDKNYLLQESLDLLASKICSDMINGIIEHEIYLGEILDKVSITDFIKIIDPILKENNKSYQIIEKELETYIDNITINYIQIYDKKI